MLNQEKDLFWLIRQEDDIVIFSDNADLASSMQASSHTHIAYINVWPNVPVDLILIDEGKMQSFEFIKSHLKPDTRVILHNSNHLNELLKTCQSLLFEQERLDYLVFHSNPLIPTGINFFHPRFEKYFKELDTNLCSFSRDYYNPHIYRALIQLGSRIENTELLLSLCQKVIDTYPETSADVGGCLCVMGYQFLIDKNADNDLLTRINHYCNLNIGSDNPHVIRWVISLRYLCGLFNEEIIENSEKAIEHYIKSYEADYRKFSSLICTKQMSACYKIACLYLELYNDNESTLKWFKNGIELAKSALSFDPEKTIGKNGVYVPFAFSELAEISNIAALCVNGYNNIELYERNPAVYKKLITSNHFGLVTYCQQLEKRLCELEVNANPRI